MTIRLTPRQHAAMAAIRQLMADRGYPPSLDELATTLGVTTKQARAVLVAVRRKGAISRHPAGRRVVIACPSDDDGLAVHPLPVVTLTTTGDLL
jgi:SOS-response transcriptional repressor LexA